MTYEALLRLPKCAKRWILAVSNLKHQTSKFESWLLLCCDPGFAIFALGWDLFHPTPSYLFANFALQLPQSTSFSLAGFIFKHEDILVKSILGSVELETFFGFYIALSKGAIRTLLRGKGGLNQKWNFLWTVLQFFRKNNRFGTLFGTHFARFQSHLNELTCETSKAVRKN